MLNLDDFDRHIVGVFVRMRPLPRVPQHKRRLLLFVFLHLARVEDEFPVSVSDDYVANLLDIERTGPTMRMDWRWRGGAARRPMLTLEKGFFLSDPH